MEKITLGIDPGATLATSTWCLTQDALPTASGPCDALPDLTAVAHVIIESIQAAALVSSTGKAGQRGSRGGFNTLTGVIFTEGELFGLLRASCGPPAGNLRIHLAPRTAILQAYLGYWPYRKGLKVDAAVLARLTATPSLAPLCRRTAHLSTVDKRDAYLAAIYPPA